MKSDMEQLLTLVEMKRDSAKEVLVEMEKRYPGSDHYQLSASITSYDFCISLIHTFITGKRVGDD